MSNSYTLNIFSSFVTSVCTNSDTKTFSMDLSRPMVSILKEEMESRGVMKEDADYRQLAIEAVHTVNPELLRPEDSISESA